MALFRVAAEPKTIHSKADIGPGSLYLLLLARMIVLKLTHLLKKLSICSQATPCCSNCPIARGFLHTHPRGQSEG